MSAVLDAMRLVDATCDARYDYVDSRVEVDVVVANVADLELDVLR